MSSLTPNKPYLLFTQDSPTILHATWEDVPETITAPTLSDSKFYLVSAVGYHIPVTKTSSSEFTMLNPWLLNTERIQDFRIRTVAEGGRITNLTADNKTSISNQYRAIIDNCEFNEDSDGWAVNMENCVDCSLERVSFDATTVGLYLKNCEDITISNCMFTGTGNTHIILENCRNIQIEGCSFDGGDIGIALSSDSTYAIIFDCSFSNMNIAISDGGLWNRYEMVQLENVTTFMDSDYPDTQERFSCPEDDFRLNVGLVDTPNRVNERYNNIHTLQVDSNFVQLVEEDNALFIESSPELVDANFVATAGQTTFVPTEPFVGHIIVQVNNRVLAPNKYQVNGPNQVVIFDPAEAGDKVRLVGAPAKYPGL
jgi:hypothetical protein